MFCLICFFEFWSGHPPGSLLTLPSSLQLLRSVIKLCKLGRFVFGGPHGLEGILSNFKGGSPKSILAEPPQHPSHSLNLAALTFPSLRPKRTPSAVNSPSPVGEEAVKKFGNAKSISSDMYFGGPDQVTKIFYCHLIR